VAGANRFETATEISRSRFAPTPGRNLSVFIATGQNFPDALAGVPPASVHEGPILLVGRDVLPQTTIDELNRLQPADIWVLGGTGAVSQAVFDELGAYGTDVIRVSGDSRFSTAVEVGGLVTGQDPPDPLTVFIATGGNYPDALAGGAVAGAVPGPIFLVTQDSAPRVVLDEIGRLRPDRLIILGGTGAVSQQTEDQLRARTGG
jgi:putative cell wall-binding protein